MARSTTPGNASYPGQAVTTDRLLDLLSLRARVVSENDVARYFHGQCRQPRRAAAAALSRLADQGLIERRRLYARPAPAWFGEPLARWGTDSREAPEFAAIAWKAEARWGRGQVATPCVVATGPGRARFADSKVRGVRASEASHDLALASLYLHMRDELGRCVETWRGEDSLGPLAENIPADIVPDAVLVEGDATTAIELVGQYSKDKLEAFHYACADFGVGYELW